MYWTVVCDDDELKLFVPSTINPVRNKKLSYRRETLAMLCISWNVVLLLYEECKQIACQPEEHFQQMPLTCIVLSVHASLQ